MVDTDLDLDDGCDEESEDCCYGYVSNDDLSPLRDLLRDIEFYGCVLGSQQISTSQTAGLYVTRAGPIQSLPLTPGFHAKLQQLGHAVPDALQCRWQLNASLLRATNPEWDMLILKVSQKLSKRLGLVDTQHVQPCLEKVVLIDNGIQYDFASDAEATAGKYASLVVMPASPGQEAHFNITGEEEVVAFAAPEHQQLGCAALFPDRDYELRPNKDGCCIAFVYQLIQSEDDVPLIKDEDWYLHQLQLMLEELDSDGTNRWFYLLDSRYAKPVVDDVQRLNRRHQFLARFLQKAEQVGLLDVHLAWLSSKEKYPAERTALGLSKIDTHRGSISARVDTWRTLTGQDPGWVTAQVKLEHDSLIQGVEYFAHLRAHNQQVTDQTEGYHDGRKGYHKAVHVKRWKEYAVFAIWPQAHRWHVLCRQGQARAMQTLRALLRKQEAALLLPNQAEDASQISTLSSDQTADGRHKVEEQREDVRHLIETIWANFGLAVRHEDVKPFKSFVEMAVAYGNKQFAVTYWHAKFEDKVLDDGTATDLFMIIYWMDQPGSIQWQGLYSLLRALAFRALRPSDTDPVHQLVTACRALITLDKAIEEESTISKREEDAGWWPQLAQIAVKVMHSLQVLALHGRLGANDLEVARLRAKPSAGLMIPKMHGGNNGLIHTIAEMVMRVKSKAREKQKVVAAGLECTHSQLVELYLAHPSVFGAADVLGPACDAILDTEGDFAIIESPAMIKLLAGSMSGLQQATQQLPVHEITTPLFRPCDCLRCQALEAFLRHPQQTSLMTEGTEEEFGHDDRQLLNSYGVDAHYHCNKVEWRKSLCIERQRNFEESLRQTARIKHCLSQVIVTLFERSGQPPSKRPATTPPKEVESEVEVPEPELTYDLWRRPAKRHKIV